MISDLWSPPEGAGTKTNVPLHVPFMEVTYIQYVVEFRGKEFWRPNPPCTPKSQPWGMT